MSHFSVLVIGPNIEEQLAPYQENNMGDCPRQFLVFEDQEARVFCASLADVLDPEVPALWLAELLEIVWRTPRLDWQLLTKRPQLWRARFQAAHDAALFFKPEFCAWLSDWLDGSTENAPANVWWGTTTEDQERAAERIPALQQIPARVRFLSVEPMLGRVVADLSAIDWVICGGESGPESRPLHPAWARELRDQCQDAGVPFFFKQWGDWLPQHQDTADRGQSGGGAIARSVHTFADGAKSFRIGKLCAGALLDGIEHREFPRSDHSALGIRQSAIP